MDSTLSPSPSTRLAPLKSTNGEHTSANLVGSIERHGMMEAEPSALTTKMLAELEAAGEATLSDNQLTALSVKFAEWIEQYRYDRQMPAAKGSGSWFLLFKEVDRDSSGFVTFDELTLCVREKLKKSSSVFPDLKIKQLWCTLDVDCDNALHRDEMSGFLKLGLDIDTPAPENAPIGEHTTAALKGPIERHGMSGAVPSQPTAEMRRDLHDKGIPLPNDDELIAHSESFNVWIEAFRHDNHMPQVSPHHSFYLISAVKSLAMLPLLSGRRMVSPLHNDR